MKTVAAIIVLILLTGCASEYSSLPDPTGNWIPANPDVQTTSNNPAPTPLHRVRY